MLRPMETTIGREHWLHQILAKPMVLLPLYRKAQKAVRELKAKVYNQKTEPVETRWIGSPHPFGKGRDIVVFIRDGYYSLDKPLIFRPEDGGERVETNLPTGAFEYHKLRDHYVTYAAYPGEKPVISGGKPITNWKKNGSVWTTKVNDHRVEMLLADGKCKHLPERLTEVILPLHVFLKLQENYLSNRVI